MAYSARGDKPNNRPHCASMNTHTSLKEIAASIADVKTQIADLALIVASLKKSDAPDDLVSFSIERFCKRNGISKRQYFKMQRQGIGPHTLKIGGRKGIRISLEAERDWIREREAERATEQQAAE